MPSVLGIRLTRAGAGCEIMRKYGMDLLPVRLRPFAEPDLELFDRFARDPAFSEPFEWVGFTPPGGYRRRREQDGLLGSAPYCLAVVTVDDDALPAGSIGERPNGLGAGRGR